MKLSMEFLHIKITEKFGNVRLYTKEGENPYVSMVRIFSLSGVGICAGEDMGSDESLLYVMIPDPFRESLGQKPAAGISPGRPLVLFERESAHYPDNPQIILMEGSDPYEIFNYILELFQIYNGWAERVNQAILGSKSLQEILELTAPIVGNPMYIADLSFKMLAHINMELDEISVIWRYQIRYGYLPYNVMMDLVETGEMELLNNTVEAFYLDSKSFYHPFISKSIWYRGKMQGHFYIVEIYKRLTQCDIEIAEYLGELLSAATYGRRNYLAISSFYHEHFMVDVLENTLTDVGLIRNQLGSLGWKLEGDYCIFLMQMKNDDEALKRHVMAFLLEGFDAQAFLYQGYVAAIYSQAATERLIPHLGTLTKNFGRTGGLSEGFLRFDKMGSYYRQAECAIQEGKRRDPGSFLFTYQNCFLIHLGQVCESSFPGYQPVEVLRLYDKKNKSEYCRTLYTYLINERNAVRTAGQLYLHRNTLKYRLEKIQELIRLDLELPSVRMRLLSALLSEMNDKV